MLHLLKQGLYFETVQLVTVRSVKLGILHRSLQALVILYILIYAIIWRQGYQAISVVNGSVYTKTKGVSYLAEGSEVIPFDANDLVIPPNEDSALFLVTRSLEASQTRGICAGADATERCQSDADCPIGTITANGINAGQCNVTFGYCNIRTWCPLENDSLPFHEYIGVENFTIFFRSSITYVDFQEKRDNADRTALGYNIFSIDTLLKNENISDIKAIGGILEVDVDWTCNFNVEECKPKFIVTRIDSGTASRGFNYRGVQYLDNPVGETSTRLLTKYYGIRILIKTTGVGSRFDIVPLLLTIGSGVGLFGIASFATDILLQYILPSRKNINIVKRTQFSLGKKRRHQNGQQQADETYSSSSDNSNSEKKTSTDKNSKRDSINKKTKPAKVSSSESSSVEYDRKHKKSKGKSQKLDVIGDVNNV